MSSTINHSPVQLISVTPNAEQLIAYCARVSNPKNQDNPDNEKLIRYLIKHQHWSPLEMAHVVMSIEASRTVTTQCLRHRSFAFQEFSQRYADVSSIRFAKPPELRRQDTKNRQNSIDDLDDATKAEFSIRAKYLFDSSQRLYKEMLGAGVAKECARDVLPLATPSRLYMAGSVRSWVHYVQLRCGNGTQKEHQDIAKLCRKELHKALPTVMAAVESLKK